MKGVLSVSARYFRSSQLPEVTVPTSEGLKLEPCPSPFWIPRWGEERTPGIGADKEVQDRAHAGHILGH